jgi:hypothetical protein
MITRKIGKKIIPVLCFISFALIIVACNNEQGRMNGNNSMGMNNFNWIQILIGLGIVRLIGFMIWVAVSRWKR